MGNLLPDRHPNRDFFILDVSDAAPKDDMASMEHPVFSLSVKPDMRELDYSHDGKRVIVVPSGKGLATIMDKDILLYCISKLVHELNAGTEISPWVELSAHEVMVATNWRTNRESYQRFEDALDRLRGTTIKTNIKTGDHTQVRGFGLIDEYEIIRRNERGEEGPFGRMTRARVKVSDWTFRAVQGMEVLTINPQYFRLRRPLERRIYEIARKHAGDGARPFLIGLGKLKRKVGSNSPDKKFKYFIKQIAEDGHIPDYDIELRGTNVVFTAKRPGFTQGQIEMALGLPMEPSPALLGKARRAAPGFDIYALYAEWKAFAERMNEPPRSLDAAFLGFCKKRAKQS
ncbi:replication initiator protein A [Tritonibacter multivorans]|nr:replication initiator protein A [Tritonibacter multivorans]MDA7423046.1 replication initiator protein A [Tritonibacter multivorans]